MTARMRTVAVPIRHRRLAPRTSPTMGQRRPPLRAAKTTGYLRDAKPSPSQWSRKAGCVHDTSPLDSRPRKEDARVLWTPLRALTGDARGSYRPPQLRGAGRVGRAPLSMGDVSGLSPEQVERVISLAMDLAREGGTEELLEFFDHGLGVDTPDAQGNTALMLAAYHGHADTVRALIARGADVDLRNERDQAPVAGALFKGEEEVVGVLVEAGADLDAGTPSARVTARMFGQTHLIP